MIELTWFMGCDAVLCWSLDLISILLGFSLAVILFYFTGFRKRTSFRERTEDQGDA